jgi:hypothetical protein
VERKAEIASLKNAICLANCNDIKFGYDRFFGGLEPMARHGITKKLEEGIKPEQAFEAAQAAFKELGWEIYKMRPIAFLVEARITIDGGYILANVITTVFGEREIKLTIKGDTASQATVEAQAEKILAALEKALASKK